MSWFKSDNQVTQILQDHLELLKAHKQHLLELHANLNPDIAEDFKQRAREHLLDVNYKITQLNAKLAGQPEPELDLDEFLDQLSRITEESPSLLGRRGHRGHRLERRLEL